MADQSLSQQWSSLRVTNGNICPPRGWSTLCASCTRLCTSPGFSQALLSEEMPLDYTLPSADIHQNAKDGCTLCHEMQRRDHGWGKDVLHNPQRQTVHITLRRTRAARLTPPQDPAPDLVSFQLKSDTTGVPVASMSFHVFADDGPSISPSKIRRLVIDIHTRRPRCSLHSYQE